MRLKELIQSMYPLKPYTLSGILSRLKPGHHNHKVQYRAKLEELVSRVGFPPLGDRIVAHEIAWWGYRFQASMVGNRALPSLPVLDRPVFAMEMAPYLPQLTPKLEAMPLIRIEPKDLHPFLIGLSIWCPLRLAHIKTSKKERNKGLPRIRLKHQPIPASLRAARKAMT